MPLILTVATASASFKIQRGVVRDIVHIRQIAVGSDVEDADAIV